MARVMVVDDETVIAMQLEAYLQDLGHEVTGSASSGREAVQLAERLRPDIILMDIKLPGEVDGIDAAQAIRRSLDIPVVFITAYAEDRLVQRARSVKPLGYLIKPFLPNEIKAAIEVAIDRMELEQHLLESEQRYEMATTAGRVGVWDWDLAADRVYVEPILFALLGYAGDRNWYSFQEWIDWTHPEDRDWIEAELRNCATGTSSSLELERRLRHQDGYPLWFLTRGRVVCNGQGEPVRLVGTDADISDRKRAELALTKSKERFRNLVETTSDLIWEMNRYQEFTYVSPQILNLLGYRPAELTGKNPYRLLARGQGEMLKKQLTNMAVADRCAQCFETEFLHKDGTTVVIETSGVRFHDDRGRLLGFRGIGRDVSERKRLEEALRDSNVALERKVMERTRHLLEAARKLRQQRKELSEHKAEVDQMNRQLGETNAALSFMAKAVERGRDESEKRIASLIRTKMLPLVQRLRSAELDDAVIGQIDTLNSYLDGLVSSLSAGADIASRLSETEWNVAVQIREGRTIREIASKFTISVDTVKTHRKNIRRKLGLTNTSVNLGTYLMTKLR